MCNCICQITQAMRNINIMKIIILNVFIFGAFLIILVSHTQWHSRLKYTSSIRQYLYTRSLKSQTTHSFLVRSYVNYALNTPRVRCSALDFNYRLHTLCVRYLVVGRIKNISVSSRNICVHFDYTMYELFTINSVYEIICRWRSLKVREYDTRRFNSDFASAECSRNYFICYSHLS